MISRIADFAQSCTIRVKLARYDLICFCASREQFSLCFKGRAPIPSFYHNAFQHGPFMIYGAPQIQTLAIHSHKNFVNFDARATYPHAPRSVRVALKCHLQSEIAFGLRCRIFLAKIGPNRFDQKGMVSWEP